MQYPFDKKPVSATRPQDELMSRVRARNALHILLDVAQDFGDVQKREG
jgi:hypothetical protein